MATDIIARGMAANAKKSVIALDNKIESEKWIGTRAEWEAVDKSTIKDGTIVYITDDETVILYDKAEMEKIAAQVATDSKAAETAAQTAQSIADSLPDDYTTAVAKIAENTAEISAMKLTDKELKRRVDALYSIGQGITHQFETDTDTAYAKTVPTGGKLMSVKSVGGRSIVWNQLISQIVEKTSNGIATTKVDSKSLHISGTSSAVCFIPISPVQTGISNHKYLFHSHASDTTALSSGTGFYNDNGGNRWHEYGKGIIFTMDGNGTIAIAFRVNSNITVDFSITPQIYDLTTMFGSGNEPTSVEEFEKMFPNDYYQYNAGKIVSAGTEEIVEQGRNLWDEIWEEGSIVSDTGLDLPAPTAIRSKNYTPIIPNSTYIFVYVGSAKFENVKTRFYDHNKKYIGFNDNDGQTVYPNRAFVAPVNAFYVRFTLPPGYGNVYKNDIALIAGSSGTYAPFHRNVYQIPEAIKALPGYGVEGNVVDYEAKTYMQNNAIDGTAIKALDAPIVTDISTLIDDDFLRNLTVEAGGSVTFKNSNDSYRIPVPSEEEYIVKLSEVGGTT